MTDTRTLYKSDMRPEFEPFTIQPPEVKGFQYSGDLAYEIRSHHLDGQTAIDVHTITIIARGLPDVPAGVVNYCTAGTSASGSGVPTFTTAGF